MNPGIVLAANHSDYARYRVTKAAEASGKLKRTSLHKIQLLVLRLLHHRIALRFKLVAGFPFREFGTVRDFVADYKEKLRVLHRAGQIPIRFHFIGNLMVVVEIELIGPQRSVGRTREQMLLVADVERRHTRFRSEERRVGKEGTSAVVS